MYKSEGGLGGKIPPGKRVLADSAYESIEACTTKKNVLESQAVKEIRKRSLARHETFNARIKCFNVLKEQFRCTAKDRMLRHKMTFFVICAFVQYDMENGRPLFDV